MNDRIPPVPAQRCETVASTVNPKEDVFDAAGDVITEHGPHPSLHDTSGRGICDDLA